MIGKYNSCLSNVGILGSGATCKCLKLTEILGHNYCNKCCVVWLIQAKWTSLNHTGLTAIFLASCKKTQIYRRNTIFILIIFANTARSVLDKVLYRYITQTWNSYKQNQVSAWDCVILQWDVFYMTNLLKIRIFLNLCINSSFIRWSKYNCI